MLPHSVYDAAHLHVDATHAPPTPQLLPHMPQLSGSVAGSMQAPPHSKRGATHEHIPATHVSPAMQA